jgi:hypothetical protein
MRRHSPHRQKQPECLRMPHSRNLTFDLVELHGLTWFNFSMKPTRSLSLGGCRRDRFNRRVVGRHMAASGVTAIDPEVRTVPVGFQSYSCRTPSAPLTSLIAAQRRPHHPARVAGLRVKSTPLTTMPHTRPMAGETKRRPVPRIRRSAKWCRLARRARRQRPRPRRVRSRSAEPARAQTPRP